MSQNNGINYVYEHITSTLERTGVWTQGRDDPWVTYSGSFNTDPTKRFVIRIVRHDKSVTISKRGNHEYTTTNLKPRIDDNGNFTCNIAVLIYHGIGILNNTWIFHTIHDIDYIVIYSLHSGSNQWRRSWRAVESA